MTTIDGQKPISGADYLVNKQRDERKTGDGVMGKDDFMKLLIAQLQNQDPTNPMKDNEFIAQMAQFSSLEQTMNLSKSFEKFAEAQGQSQLIQYNQFVGKNIKWHQLTEEVGEDGKPVVSEGTGMIASVKFVDGSAVFTMEEGKELTPGNISEVLASGSGGSTNLVEASMLIGKNVGYMDGEVEKSGLVVSVSNKEGKLQYILEDGSRINGKEFTSISR